MDNITLTWIFGIIAILLGNIISNSLNSRPWIIGLKIISSFAWIFYYYFLGAQVATVNFLIIAIVSIICLFRPHLPYANSLWYPISFIAINTYLSIIKWQDIFSIFSCLGTSSNIISKWQLETKNIRLWIYLTIFLLLIYNIHTQAWLGVLSNLISLPPLLIATYRFDIRHQKQVK